MYLCWHRITIILISIKYGYNLFENKIIARAFLIDDLYHLHIDASVNINKQTVNAVGSKRLRDRINRISVVP